MLALVPSAGTTAGVQLAAVFQLPLAADAQEVCAALRPAKIRISATGTSNCAALGKKLRNIVSKKIINAIFAEAGRISSPRANNMANHGINHQRFTGLAGMLDSTTPRLWQHRMFVRADVHPIPERLKKSDVDPDNGIFFKMI